jgi:membrane fusion protein, heavy metal efflux system
MRRVELLLAVVVFGASALGCRRTEADKPKPAAVVTGKKPESELARITLTPEAEARLGLTVASATLHTSSRTRTVGGDVLPSSGRSLMVVAPVAGRLAVPGGTALAVGQTVRRGDPLLRLTPVAGVDRDLKATADRTVAIAESKLAAMESRLARAEKLLADGAGSARAVEEARADRDTARAELEAAKSRVGMLERSPLDSDVAVTLRAPEDGVVRAVSALPSSLVPPGAPLVEIVGTGALWVKVNVFVGDLRSIRHGSAARVRALTAKPAPTDPEALPVAGPPTSDPLTSSFDLYYALPKEADFRPGERVAVTLSYGDEVEALHVPASSLVRDAAGGAWVYVLVAEHAFERRRVEVEHVGAEGVRIARGLAADARVVVTGAAELFGAELGTGK